MGSRLRFPPQVWGGGGGEAGKGEDGCMGERDVKGGDGILAVSTIAHLPLFFQ